MSDIEQEKQELIAKREELRERLRSIHRDYGQGLDRDSEEQAQQLENAEVLEGIAKATAEELERIDRRLNELESS
ncbi:MAG: hypothetical protein HUJ29_03595 [Gammaproteobacteria bacterium]|nr:hypothetical protein [Gammaproteobacteria bacterium]